MKTLKLKVNEIKCQGCIDKITKALKKIKGITAFEINLSTKTIQLQYNSEKVTVEKITDVISKLNYNPIIL